MSLNISFVELKTQKHRIISVAILFWIIGCSNSIDPIDENASQYAVYGFLELGESTHYIRVYDMSKPFTSEATSTIDAEVTLQNLTSGEIFILESERREIDGVFQHNFVHNGEVEADTEYKLTIKHSNGEQLELSTLVPPITDYELERISINCYDPVTLRISPLNGGLLVIEFGTNGRINGIPLILNKDFVDESQIEYTFIPNTEVARLNRQGDHEPVCGEYLKSGRLFVAFFHYAKDFYREPDHAETDPLGSIHRFGAISKDTLVIPIDTTYSGW